MSHEELCPRPRLVHDGPGRVQEGKEAQGSEDDHDSIDDHDGGRG